jgi:pimeloyl-ACP methyl ester carboxylesterase
MPNIQLKTGSVAFSDQGTGTPVVLLHANPGDRRDWDAVVGALAAEHRVLAVDWPGYGDSPALEPAESSSAMRYADVLADWVAALDLPPAIFIGNSVGGYAAARLALDQPTRVRGLVLVNSGGFSTPTWLTRAFCWLKGRPAVTRLIAGLFARTYLRLRNRQVATMVARADEERRLPTRVAVDAAIWRSFNRPEHDLRQAATRIEQPTLMVWGRRDPILQLARDGQNARRSLQHAELVEVDSGHAPFAEAPEQFLAAVRPFLARVARAASAA